MQCAISAAVFSDIANTVRSVDISFNPAQIDVRVKQRSTGAISGDNVYNSITQTIHRSFAPATSFVFAMQVQHAGVRIRNLAPGQIKGLAVKVSVTSAAVKGERSTFRLTATSGAGGGSDFAEIQAAARVP
ncbi:MAG: hypothetical protein JO291_07550 [Acidimicrobiia bacterium]|nr:hypothetical protein [Acidimicrobiia bacterium]